VFCKQQFAKAPDSEIVTVELLKRYCLPFILYAPEPPEAITISTANVGG